MGVVQYAIHCSSHLVTVCSSGQCEHTGDWLVSCSEGWLYQTGQFQTSAWASSQREGCRWKATTVKVREQEKDEAGWTTRSSVCPLYLPSSLNETLGTSLSRSLTSGSCRWGSSPSQDSLPFSRELWILSRVFLMRRAVSLAEGFWYQHSFISFTKAERVWERHRGC